ncbi:unnamed protein product [Camellia sinensis]
MSDGKGKGVIALKKLGVEVQKGDHYSCQKTQQIVTKYNSNGQTSSYQSEEKAAVVTKIGKSSTTTVKVFQRRVEETIHHKALPPVKDKITHFSHRHDLHRYVVQKRDKINCNICEAEILDKAWSCERCKFFIHKSCESIPQKIKHKSHLRDTLILRSSTNYACGEFICDACRDSDKGFHYHCSPCKFDIHVACAGLPSAVNYPMHKNPLILCYDFPVRSSETVKCKVCDMKINKKGWAYYNDDSKFIAHIYCAVNKKKKDSILAIQKRLQSLQMK